jgi:AcrR family transcriptional regulator
MSTSSRTSSRLRLEQREQEILQAATELFAGAGFHATSTRRIAEAAGVSEGTVFHYFRSKHDLMLAILDRFYSQQLNQRAEAILNEVMGTRERLRELALNHVRQLAADQALMMRLIQVYIGVDLLFINTEREPGDAESPIRTLNRQYVGYFDRTLREGIARGELRGDVPLTPCRDLYFGGLEYGMRTYLYRRGANLNDDLESYIDELLEPVWRFLCVADPTPGSDADSEAVTARLERVARRLEELAGSSED